MTADGEANLHEKCRRKISTKGGGRAKQYLREPEATAESLKGKSELEFFFN